MASSGAKESFRDQMDRLLDEHDQAEQHVATARQAVEEAQQRLREAEARRAALARQIAALIESAGITTSSPGSTAGASELRRYRLVRKIKDGRPAADGEPDPAHPILIDGQPVNYANRQTKLSPSAAYRAAVRVGDADQDDDIDTVALIDANAGNAVISTNITWGSVRGR